MSFDGETQDLWSSRSEGEVVWWWAGSFLESLGGFFVLAKALFLITRLSFVIGHLRTAQDFTKPCVASYFLLCGCWSSLLLV